MAAHFVNLLDELQRRSLRMAGQVEDIVHEACEAVFAAEEMLARRVMRRDAEVDSEEVAVESEVVRLMALYQPVGSDLRMLCTILKVNNDLEHVADCAVNMAERARHQVVQPLAADSAELREMCPAVKTNLRNAIQAYGSGDAEVALGVLADDTRVDTLYGQIVRQVVAGAASSPDDVPAYLDLLSVAKNLERIADHATNIAEDVVFLSTGQIVRHCPGEARD